MQEIQSQIAEHPFFSGFDEHYIKAISKTASLMRFESGQYLLREGDPSEAFFAIKGGNVSIEIFVSSGGLITIQTLGRGDVIGWSWLLEPFKIKFDAKAINTVDVLRFDAVALRQICERDSKLGYAFLKKLVGVLEQRLQATRRQLIQAHGVSY